MTSPASRPGMALGSDLDKRIIVFTDGSSRGNPGPGGYAAVAIYPNAHGEMHVDEIGGREDLTTNNRMELRAVMEAIKNFMGYYQDLTEYSFVFYIDSSYVVNGIKTWMHGWKRNNWISSTKEEVKNRDLWEEVYELLNPSAHGTRKKLDIQLNLVKGHAGHAGNERCDVIATTCADNKEPHLYTGPLSQYTVTDILDVLQKSSAVLTAKTSESKGGSSGSGSSSKKAFSYVSLVDGKIAVHQTWKGCEDRVKGKSKARFKKSFSKDDESKIIEEFLRNA